MFLICILNLHARLYKRFSKYQEEFPSVSWWVTIKTFIDFMCNWQQLCNTWVTRYQAWLTLYKKFVLHKGIIQRFECKPFKDFTEEWKKTNWTIIFLSNLYSLFYGLALEYFFSSLPGKCLPLLNSDLKSNWSGRSISFPENWIILTDMLFHPWDLWTLRFFIIRKMSFSLIVEKFKRLSVLYLNFGNIVAFLTGVHWGAKSELISSGFFWNQIPVCHQQE